jgi:hypothetical protein
VTRVVVLADTHIRRGSARRLPDSVYAELERADLILHAGDVVVGEVLDDLRRFAPLHAVLGNNDHELVSVLPEVVREVVDGVDVAMIHDSGPRPGRERRLHDRFPGVGLVVFGHSHIPWDAAGLHGAWLFNPGSPTERRRQPVATMGLVDLDAGRIVRTEVRPV